MDNTTASIAKSYHPNEYNHTQAAEINRRIKNSLIHPYRVDKRVV